MSKFYKKEIPEAPVFVNGHPLRFDLLDTSDPMLISELDNCVRRAAGGISEITADQYADELKKKEQETLSGNSLRPQFKRTELSALHGNPGAAVASRFTRPQQSEWQRGNGEQQPASHPMPDPIEVPTAASFQLPPVAKMKDLKDMADRAKPK